jgi:hypothetical protein
MEYFLLLKKHIFLIVNRLVLFFKRVCEAQNKLSMNMHLYTNSILKFTNIYV